MNDSKVLRVIGSLFVTLTGVIGAPVVLYPHGFECTTSADEAVVAPG